MAEQVYSRYPNHHLGNSKTGMPPKTSTRFVRDLTDGRYGAVLMSKPDSDLEQKTRKMWGDKADEILRVIEEETVLGNIRPPNHNEGKSFCYSPPALVFVNVGEDYDHSVVDALNRESINDGVITDQPTRLGGVLEIFRNF